MACKSPFCNQVLITLQSAPDYNVKGRRLHCNLRPFSEVFASDYAGIGKKEEDAPHFSVRCILISVPKTGLEPVRLAALVFETNASTNSAIWARLEW